MVWKLRTTAWILIVLAASCAPVGTGGSSPVTQPVTPQVSKPVTLQFLGSEAPETFKAAIDLYQSKNPNITVVYNPVPFADLNNTIQARLGSKDSSLDIYMADEPRVPSLVSRGFLVPLESAQSKMQGTVSSQAIDAVTWNGKVYSLPISTSTAVLFYNKKLLNAARVQLPGPSAADRWTWEQTIDAAKSARGAGAKWGFSFQQVDRYYQLQVLPESLRAKSGLTGDGLLTPDITNPGWLAAMTWYGSIFSGEVSPRGIAVGQVPDLFANGELAFMVGNPIYVQRFAAVKDLEYGVAPQPYFAKGEAVTPTDGWSLGISPFGSQQDEARKFVEFMALDPAGTTAWSAGRSLTPANTAAFEKWIVALAGQGGSQVAGIDKLIRSELQNTAIHRPRTIGYIAFEEIMNRCFADIRNGSDPKTRLEQASQELASALSRLK